MSSTRLFSREEANRLLALVRPITEDAVRCYASAKEAIGRLEAFQAGVEQGDPQALASFRRQDEVVTGLLEQLRRLVDELEGLGCRLRDYERGVVDFPAACLSEDGFVVYCWALGEEQISHFHSEHEGHEERRTLPVGR